MTMASVLVPITIGVAKLKMWFNEDKSRVMFFNKGVWSISSSDYLKIISGFGFTSSKKRNEIVESSFARIRPANATFCTESILFNIPAAHTCSCSISHYTAKSSCTKSKLDLVYNQHEWKNIILFIQVQFAYSPSLAQEMFHQNSLRHKITHQLKYVPLCTVSFVARQVTRFVKLFMLNKVG